MFLNNIKDTGIISIDYIILIKTPKKYLVFKDS